MHFARRFRGARQQAMLEGGMRVGFGIDAQRGAGFLVENIDCRGVFIPEDPTDEQRRIRRSASDFVDREVLPQVERLESLDLWESRPLMRKRGSLDLLAFTYALVDSAPIDTVGPSVGPKARSLLLSLRRRGVGTTGAAARAFGLVGAIACAGSAGAQSIEGIVDEPTGEAGGSQSTI